MPLRMREDRITARRALVWGQYLFLAVGFVAIGYCAMVISEAAHYQVYARERLRELPVAPTTTQDANTTSQQKGSLSGNEPTLVGKIDIPRVHISAMVAEGTSSRVLRLAAGHMP